MRKYASAEERAAKNQKTTVRHFGFTEKIYHTIVTIRVGSKGRDPNLPAIVSISVGSKGFDSNLLAIDTIRLAARVMTQTCRP